MTYIHDLNLNDVMTQPRLGLYPSPNKSRIIASQNNALNDHCQRTFSRIKMDKGIFQRHIGLPSECIKGFWSHDHTRS